MAVVARAQSPSVVPKGGAIVSAEPGKALADGIREFRRGEYEQAGASLAVAKQGAHRLSERDRKSLEDYILKTERAMRARSQATLELKQAESSFADAKYDVSLQLLNRVNANGFLTADDRRRADALSEKLKGVKKGSSWGWVFGRKQRVETPVASVTPPARTTTPEVTKAKATPPRETTTPTVTRATTSPESTITTVETAKPKASISQADAKRLVAEGRKWYAKGQFDHAERWAKAAQQYQGSWLFSDSPDKLLRDIHAARAKQRPTTPSNKSIEGVAGTTTTPKGTPTRTDALEPNATPQGGELRTDGGGSIGRLTQKPKSATDRIGQGAAQGELATSAKPVSPTIAPPGDTTRQQALALLAQAKEAIKANQLDQAARLCDQARSLNAHYALLDDTPDKVMAEVKRQTWNSKSSPARAATGTTPTNPSLSAAPTGVSAPALPNGVRRSQAITMLTKAESLLKAGQLADAEKLVSDAEALKAEYTRYDKQPSQVRAAIAAERARQTDVRKLAAADPSLETTIPQAPAAVRADARVEASQLVIEARASLNKLDYKRAAEQALKAKATGVVFAAHEDSPDKILRAIDAVRTRSIERKNPVEAVARLEEARQLMGRARQMLDQGFYEEASELAQNAANLNAPFELNEMRPEQMLTEIRGKANQSLLAKAVVDAPRQLPGAVAKASNVQEASEGAPSNPGATLKSTTESLIKRGNFSEARRTAMALQLGPYGMQKEAGELLASIEQSEKKGQEASRLMEAGINAMRRQDHAQAQSYLNAAAEKANTLTADQQQKLQDLLAMARQGSGVRSAPSAPGRARATDRAPALAQNAPGAPAPNPPAPMPNAPAPAGTVDTDRIQQAKDRERVESERLRRVVISALEQSGQQVRSDPNVAIATLESTLQTVQDSPLDKDLTAPLIRTVEQRIRIYRTDRKRYELEQLERERQKATVDSRRRLDMMEITKQNQIKELSKRFNDLMQAGQYHDAEVVAYQITEIDPDDLFGHAAYWKAQFARHYALAEDVELRKQEGWWQTMQQVEEADIPFSDDKTIVYPDAKTWENLSISRQKYKSVDLSEKTPATEEIERALSRPITFEFDQTPLTDVLEFIHDFTGINVVPDQQGLQLAGIEPDHPITLNLRNVTLKSALKLLLEPIELTYLIRDEVLLITDSKETGAKPITKVYPVADLIIPILDLNSGGVGLGGALGGGNAGQGGLGGQGFGGFSGAGQGGGVGAAGAGGAGGGGFGGGGFGGGIGGGGNLTGGGAQGVGGDIAGDVIRLIQTTIEPQSWVISGGQGSIELFAPNRSFVITQTQAIHDKIADLFTQLRRLQDLQVTVEVRFIELSEQFFERIGIDFDVEIDNNNDNYINEVATNGVSPFGRFTQARNGLPDGNHLRGVTYGIGPQGTTADGTARTGNFNIPITQSSFAAATVPAIPGLGLNPSLGGTNIGIAFLNDIDVYLLLDAVQGDARTNFLTAPKVTLFNGQTASVIVASQVPFVTGARPVISAGAVTFDPTITTVNDGTTMQVQAVISADRRYVRLTVVPIIQGITGSTPVQVTGVAGSFGLGGGGQSVASLTLNLPTISIQSVLTTVSVPDGGTVLLGGLKRHSEQRNEFGTPVLSKIPYINRLFKNTASARVSRSLMLMVTPRIVILEEEEQKLGIQTSFGNTQ